MPAPRKILVIASLAALSLAALGLLTFELSVVKPTLAKAKAALKVASPGEHAPPPGLREMIESGYGDVFKYILARELLAAEPSQVTEMKTSQRQLTELLLGLLLPLHLDRPQLETVYLTRAYMGPGVRGFEQAAAKYLATDLTHVTRTDAAKLVAIAHAPIYFLADPLRLEKKTQLLLAHVQ